MLYIYIYEYINYIKGNIHYVIYIYIHIPYQKLILQTEGIPGSPVGTAFRPAMVVGL